jgi:hypothetical protein
MNCRSGMTESSRADPRHITACKTPRCPTACDEREVATLGCDEQLTGACRAHRLGFAKHRDVNAADAATPTGGGDAEQSSVVMGGRSAAAASGGSSGATGAVSAGGTGAAEAGRAVPLPAAGQPLQAPALEQEL